MHLICHMTFQDNVIKGSYERKLLIVTTHVTTLSGLVAIGIAVVETF